MPNRPQECRTLPVRKAVAGEEWHRHFLIDGRGYYEHSHPVDRDEHAHNVATTVVMKNTAVLAAKKESRP